MLMLVQNVQDEVFVKGNPVSASYLVLVCTFLQV